MTCIYTHEISKHVAMSIKISIIIPCLNEEKNILKVFNDIKQKFHFKNYEIIFVDDNSQDNTQKEILKLSNKFKNIKYIFRKNDKDLSRSFLAGLKVSRATYAILMDCDLQHDAMILDKLYNSIQKKNIICVSGSRFLNKSINNTKKIKYIFRLRLSKILNYFINLLLNIKLTDPLTGIFIVNRNYFLKFKNKLYLNGYKIFLDFFTVADIKRKHFEIPIKINERTYGKSKLNTKTLINIGKLILNKKLFNI